VGKGGGVGTKKLYLYISESLESMRGFFENPLGRVHSPRGGGDLEAPAGLLLLLDEALHVNVQGQHGGRFLSVNYQVAQDFRMSL
jgi:hypothetical protein